VEQDGDNFVLHPLLRDLLARRLREAPTAQPSRTRSGTTRNLHRRYDSVVRPETGLLEDAAIATWELRSRSRTECPNVEMYDRVLRAYQELGDPEERLSAYRARNARSNTTFQRRHRRRCRTGRPSAHSRIRGAGPAATRCAAWPPAFSWCCLC
jgi:hypothetical protein